MYYEPGKTDHGLAHDPFKVRLTLTPHLVLIMLTNTHNRPASSQDP